MENQPSMRIWHIKYLASSQKQQLNFDFYSMVDLDT